MSRTLICSWCELVKKGLNPDIDITPIVNPFNICENCKYVVVFTQNRFALNHEKIDLFQMKQHCVIWENLHRPDSMLNIIGASTLPSMIGFGYDSPHKTWRLAWKFEEREESGFFKMILDYGNECEPIARNQFIKDFDVKCPNIPGTLLATSSIEFPWTLGASMDLICYYNEKQISVEIKCPYGQSLPFTGEIFSPEKIKPQWLIQCQIQMYCAGFKESILYIWTEQKAVAILVPYHEELMKECFKETDKFMLMLIGKSEPPKRTSKSKEIIKHLDDLGTVLKILNSK